MKRWGICLVLPVLAPLGCAVASVTAAYKPAPFSHYQPILDRMPFGSPPPAVAAPAVDPEQLKTAEQEKAEQQQIAKQLTFSALNVTPRGTTAVGFTDRSVNPPESFYLEIGASARGWTVVAADYAENWARFEKDGVTITMHLDKGLIDGPPGDDEGSQRPPGAAGETASAPSPAATASATAAPAHKPAIPGLVRLPAPARAAPSAEPGGDAPSPAKSYLERLRERKAQEQAKEQAAKTAADQATRESLQDLARKIAQDELAKREQEAADTFERLRLEQELLQARQQQEEAREAEAAQEAQPEPEPEPEAEPGQE
jgi:hypothetical protein